MSIRFFPRQDCSIRDTAKVVGRQITMLASCLRFRSTIGRRLSTNARIVTEKRPVLKVPENLGKKSGDDLNIPVRHSTRQLPPVCADSTQLWEMTEEVLEAPIGSLISYSPARGSGGLIKEDMDVAWKAADPVVQRVEFLLRGHACRIEGTRWEHWIELDEEMLNRDRSSADQTMSAMHSLLERVWEEGRSYMVGRATRMGEIQMLSQAEHASPKDTIGSRFDRLSARNDGDSEGKQGERQPFIDDFALPGPSVVMYDTVLDAMACRASSGCHYSTPQYCWLVFQDILSRHVLDGGDQENTNMHTRPSPVSFNAPIRLACSLPFDQEDQSPSSARIRDEAMQIGFGSFDALSQSTLVKRNSATYCHMLHLVSRFMPPSRIRGNIAHGIFQHAVAQGLIDETVVKSFESANTPSNGTIYDNWINENISGQHVESLPQKWTKHSLRLRHLPHDPMY